MLRNPSVAFQRGKASEQRIEQLGVPAVEGDDPPAVYDYLGDMQLRFMFMVLRHQCGRQESRLERLNLTPQPTSQVTGSRRARVAPKYGCSARASISSLGVVMWTPTPATCWIARFWDRTAGLSQGRGRGDTAAGSLFFADAGDSAATEELARCATGFAPAPCGGRASGVQFSVHLRRARLESSRHPARRGACAHLRRGRRPHQAGQRAARADLVEPYDEQELSLSFVASGKTVIYCLIANFVLSAAARGGSLPPLIASALYIATAAVSLFGIVRICSGMGHGTSGKILFMVLAFVPLVNLIALVYLSAKTNRWLSTAGWRAGPDWRQAS